MTRQFADFQPAGLAVGIAATFLRHGLTLCSNNRRHFEMVEGLQIVSSP